MHISLLDKSWPEAINEGTPMCPVGVTVVMC